MGAGGREERVVGVAAMQFSCTNDLETNVSKAERYRPTYLPTNATPFTVLPSLNPAMLTLSSIINSPARIHPIAADSIAYRSSWSPTVTSHA